MIFEIRLQDGKECRAGDFQANAEAEDDLETPLPRGGLDAVGQAREDARGDGEDGAGGDQHGKGVVAAQGQGAAEGTAGRAAAHHGEEQGAGLDGPIEVDDLGAEGDVDYGEEEDKA